MCQHYLQTLGGKDICFSGETLGKLINLTGICHKSTGTTIQTAGFLKSFPSLCGLLGRLGLPPPWDWASL